MSSPRAGWYADPDDATSVRWWDGTQWTQHVQSRPQEPQPSLAAAAVMSRPPIASSFETPVIPAGAEPSSYGSTDYAPETTGYAPQPAQAYAPDPNGFPQPGPAAATPMGPTPSGPADDGSNGFWGKSHGSDDASAGSIGSLMVDTQPAPAHPMGAQTTVIPPVSEPEPKSSKRRFGRDPGSSHSSLKPRKGFLLALAAGLLTSILIIGGMYATGMLDEEQSVREPSSDSIQLYKGDGFSLEVPRDWQQQADAGQNITAKFAGSDGAQLLIVQSPVDEALPAEADEAEVQQLVVDYVIGIVLQNNPAYKVVSREPSTVDGSAGGRVTVEGSENGQPTRLVVDGTVRDHRVWLLGLSGPPEPLTADLPMYDQVIRSFQFG